MADLTTLEDVKAWLQLDSDNTVDDALLSKMITAASAYIESWLNRSFAIQDYVFRADGNGGDMVVLPNYPVQSVSVVKVGAVDVPPSPDCMASGFWFDDDAVYLIGYQMPRGRRNVLVRYSAGYQTVPPEIARACVEVVALRFSERDRIGHQSKSLAGETVTFFIKDFPPSVQTILNNYKKVIPC